MGKLDELLRSGSANMAESIGVNVGRSPGSPVASLCLLDGRE